MDKKGKIIIFVGFVSVMAAGIIALVRNQMMKPEVAEKTVVEETIPVEDEQSTPSPTKEATKQEDTSTMVTKVAQITLTMTAPANGSTVKTSKVTVKGKTLAKAEVFANEAEGIADANGNFALTVTLDEGTNDIIITVVDVDGNVTETVLTVTYDAGE